MKANTHRPKHTNDSKDHRHAMFVARFKYGLSADHNGGRRGSAKDLKETKTQMRRQRRRKENLECN